MNNLRIAEALTTLADLADLAETPQDNETDERIAGALERIAAASERVATVLEFRLPWYQAPNITPQTSPIQPYQPCVGPYSPYTPTALCANGTNIAKSEQGAYTPPPVSYPDYSEPMTLSCGVQTADDIPF